MGSWHERGGASYSCSDHSRSSTSRGSMLSRRNTLSANFHHNSDAWVEKCKPWLNDEGVLYERQDISIAPIKDFFVIWVDPHCIGFVVWEIKSPFQNPNANKKGAFAFKSDYPGFKTDNAMREAIQCRTHGELDFIDHLIDGQINYLDRMPENVQMRIVTFLNVRSVLTLASCSPFYKKLCYSDELWLSLFSRSQLKSYMTPGLLDLTKTQGWRLCYMVATRIMKSTLKPSSRHSLSLGTVADQSSGKRPYR